MSFGIQVPWLRPRSFQLEEWNLPLTIREVDVDVSEIGLEALAREVPQRDERFLMPTSVFEQVALDLGIPAVVAVFVAEASEDLSSGVPLLAEIRCRFVFSGKNDELPSREGAPGGLDRASGFPFPL